MKRAFKIVIYTIIIEILLLSLLWAIIYFNYDKFSKSSSGVSKNTIKMDNLKIKKINLEQVWAKKDDKNIYEWELGFIKKETLITFDKEKYKKEINYTTNIFENLNNKIILNYLLKNNYLTDKYILESYRKNIWNENNLTNYINFLIYINDITKEDWEKIVTDSIKESKEVSEKIITLYENWKIDELSEYLSQNENKAKIKEKELSIKDENALLKNENFTYVLNKILDKKYMNYIDIYSKKINVDKKLIISVIASEQIRYLTTYRWQAKTMIKNNTALRNFTQFSYWLGWIKTNTFKNINYWIKTYNTNLYNKNYKKYDDLAKKEDWTYDDEKIKEILENYDSGILYIAWLVYAIQEKRNNAWFSINDKPWIIITLYNMGNNKKPHGNPDLWGSIIKIDSDYKLYFWELWFVFYSYLDYYIFNQ